MTSFLSSSLLYISFILHQTATAAVVIRLMICCISPLSYIKPQHEHKEFERAGVVYLLYPTSNRNFAFAVVACAVVVYLLYPTSNRNQILAQYRAHIVVYLLYPTSNRNGKLILTAIVGLYISFILHQTATTHCFISFAVGCISPLSYIKPQLLAESVDESPVVYLLYPTSNRNGAIVDGA